MVAAYAGFIAVRTTLFYATVRRPPVVASAHVSFEAPVGSRYSRYSFAFGLTHILKMSYMLPHLHNGWQVDQAILSEEDRVVVIRFGHDWDPTCMKMDEVLYSIAEKVKNFAVIYLVDITEVPDFNKMYELYDPCTVMFFFRNKHIMIDLGTGNNNKINWAMEDKQEMIDIIETVYRGARKGRGLVVSPKDYSTKYRY
ncbi:thioredoxin 4A isoform X1 [Podarcis lilfordi]|uniref:Thioredoxin-like protein 4A n=1 Tax=Podarcis lilfordi TaxID=74358 RepID=A0AA35KKB7_9SAUR|nr:thioredoxin 4A isoform X1 [Podarcis lilfordi]